MTTNPDQFPERLIAFRPRRWPTSLAGGPAFAAEEQRPGDRPTCAEEQVYVRADVAAAEVAALREEAEALRIRAKKLRNALSEVRHLLIGDCEYERQIIDQNERDVIALAEDAIDADAAALATKGVG